MTGWQPIETAPKDKSIIVWDDGIIGEGYYDGEDGSWWWANISRHDYTGSPIYPTLWQPLPAPPETAP